jgi:signal transduction histidine kinase/ActR/RegA family two-component response regulator
VAQVLQENCTVKLANHAALVRRDGRVVPIEDSAAPILDAAGHLIGAVLVFQDVTEKRRAEEALRDQAEALKEADRRKDEFLATLAHELRNPLAPLCNALGLLHKTDDDVKTFRRVRAMMERQLRQLVHLVDDLLDVSRISCGKIQLRKQNLDLADVVHSAVEIARPVIEAGEHELTVTLPVPPLPVEGDPTRLAQVLGNLLSNAAKYTPNGGRISLVAGQDSKRAVIRVRDNGLGIPREMLPSIFEMFTQVDKHLERAQGGLGIGLTLVRRLVEMHGGTVEAYSEGLGQGSEFVVRLPLQEEKSNSPPQASCGDVEQTGVASAGRRILVVDDNVDATDSLALLLRLQGHEVRTAFDGPSALEVAEAFRPEVMLLDIGLPGMSGYDVARQLRRLPAHQKTILVAQTGWGQEEDRSLSKEAGFDAHLVKPVELAALQQLLAQLSCWRCDSGAMPGETPAG